MSELFWLVYVYYSYYVTVKLKPAFSDIYCYGIECLRDKMSFESVGYPSPVNVESTMFCSSFYVLKVAIVGEGQCYIVYIDSGFITVL